MVDFVRVILTGMTVELLKSKLKFIGYYDINTFAIIDHFIIAKYKGLTFKIYRTGYTIMTGSLHKYFNDGKHNYNDFTIENLKTVLLNIEKNLGIELNKAIIQNIEFGVNIPLKFEAKTILNNLICFGFKKFKDVSLPNLGQYKQVENRQYFIKIYDKGRQYKLGRELLRFEIKIKRMEKIKTINLHNLGDLLTPNWIVSICNELLHDWNDVLLFESPNNPKSLTPNQRNKKIHQWSNPEYWQGLEKQERRRQKLKYETYVRDHTPNRKSLIKKLFNEKLQELTNAYFLPI